jgi:Zn finger protein HypA/HybF involved in hydrogenase expression
MEAVMREMEIFRNAIGIHDRIAQDVPQIRRGKVWCTVCEREQKVDGAKALRSGWPTCHGFTMTIDSPEERAILRAKEDSA